MRERELIIALGIPDAYGQDPPLPNYDEAAELVDVGPNLIGRQQKLAPETARDWLEMKHAARQSDIELLIVSGYRSVAYQTELFLKKLTSGQTIEQILAVNTAPGYSQHHTGRAIDIATPGSRPLTDSFETTRAFEWLTANAHAFGFSMPYGRDNVYGLNYEPWHWSQLS
jgi:D-alanyl-D-alanine carboxypeptidase